MFDYLADIANRPEYSDHYLTDFRLTRTDSVGVGAGARFRLKTRRDRFGWADVSIAEAERPRRIVEVGRGGKFNRIRLLTVYELTPAPGGTTRIEVATETEPATLSDRVTEALLRRWLQRQMARAARRLRAILEEGAERGPRATIAGL